MHTAEEFYKVALAVFGNTWAKGTYELSASDSRTLNGIAFLSAEKGGDAVNIARMILDTLIHDPEPPARYAEEKRTVVPSYSVKVFPNPASEWLNFKLPGNSGEITLEGFSISGQRVLHTTLFAPLEAIQVGHLPLGLYLAKLTNSDGTSSTQRIVIAR